MTSTIPIPQLEFPGSVDPRTGSFSRPVIDFLRRMAELIGDAAAASDLTAVLARLDALESATDAPLEIFGTNGIQVYGSEETGFEIRGPNLSLSIPPRIPGPQGEPGEDAWPIPGPKGERGEPGLLMVLREEADVLEPWPLLPTAAASTGSGVTIEEVAARVAVGA